MLPPAKGGGGERARPEGAVLKTGEGPRRHGAEGLARDSSWRYGAASVAWPALAGGSAGTSTRPRWRPRRTFRAPGPGPGRRDVRRAALSPAHRLSVDADRQRHRSGAAAGERGRRPAGDDQRAPPRGRRRPFAGSSVLGPSAPISAADHRASISTFNDSWKSDVAPEVTSAGDALLQRIHADGDRLSRRGGVLGECCASGRRRGERDR